MKKSLSMFAIGAAALVVTLAPAVLAQSASRMAAADNTFATKAAEGGMAEVQLGNLAKTNASNSDVKSFGDRMVTDHSKANDELKSIASKKGITLPTSVMPSSRRNITGSRSCKAQNSIASI
jgi:putative membrane protein